MSGHTFQNKAIRWIDERMPIFTVMQHSAIDYPTPKNLNYWWNFGSLALFVLVIMLMTGIFLAMSYTPHVDYAFTSVERIMRDVNYGWLLRYLHMNGASMSSSSSISISSAASITARTRRRANCCGGSASSSCWS